MKQIYGAVAALIAVAACDGSARNEHIVQAEVRQSGNGLLSTTLEVAIAPNSVVDANNGLRIEVETATYEGRLLGPTLRVQPGDRLEIELVNNLPPNPAQQRQGAFPHEPHTTNLHTHGLTVTPQGIGDNPFRHMMPQSTHAFAVDIPAYHTAGTNWYHPHKHGSVAFQFFGGMTGMLIVEGGPGTIDAVPEVAAAADIPMTFQAIRVGEDGRVPWLNTEATQFSQGGVFGNYINSTVHVLTNGKTAPRHTMRPSEVQRWRLLNAASGLTMIISLQGAEFNIIALDGINLEQMLTLPAGQPLVLAAGGRADVLIKAPAAGTYTLQAIDPGITGYSVSPQGTAPGIRSVHIGADFPSPTYPVTLATIVVQGDADDMALPADPFPMPTGLPPMDDLLAQTPDATRRVAFESCGQSGNMADPGNRLPSCDYYFEKYDAEYWGGLPLNNIHMMRDADDDGHATNPADRSGPRTNYQKNGLFKAGEPLFDDMNGGNIEAWTVINRSRSDHSFHIHQNPFLLTHINGQPLPVPEWRDTVLVPGAVGGGSNINLATYGTVTFRTRLNTDFPGQILMHCHVISHEDFGMMQLLEINSVD